jgi:hypothetical protein
VVHAFPAFSHPRQLWLSHQLEPRFFSAGEMLGDRESHRFGLILVTGGRLDVLSNGHLPKGDPLPAALGAGSFIGTFDGELAAASIERLQAGQPDGLEALVLEMQQLERWFLEAPGDREKLRGIIQAQLAGGEAHNSQRSGEPS